MSKKFQKHNSNRQRGKGQGRGKGVSRSQSHNPRHQGSDTQTLTDVLFSGTSRGFGFVTPPPDTGLTEDIFIPAGMTMGALDGDTVTVQFRRLRGFREGGRRTEGHVVAITKERELTLIGTVMEDYVTDTEHPRRTKKRRPRTALFFVPDNSKLAMRPLLKSEGMEVFAGDKVQVLLESRPRGRYEPGACRLLTVFGEADSREANYAAVLAELCVPVPFSPEALAEAESRAATPVTAEGRVKRRETIFTIDGADAKDLDDAVSLSEKSDGSFVLGVHIADVSAYVLSHSKLDEAVMQRGTSLYFADQVVPMLPPALSNGACSLNAGEDKWALSAIITIDQNGEPTSLKLEKSVINSCVRGVYSEVNDIIAKGNKSPFADKYKRVLPTIRRLQRLYGILHSRRKRLGGLDLDRPEGKIILNEEGHPVDVIRRQRGIAERIIEECMLMANESVARAMFGKERPCVYRIHGTPTEEHVREFVTFAHNRGLEVGHIRPPFSGLQFAAALTEANKLGIGEPISYILLRTMEKAKYSEVPSGHFGLGLSLYCHFTSPIRRLSDLATHRIISEMLAAQDKPTRLAGYAARAAAAATETELRALQAERRIEALYKTVYMADHIGEEYKAQISSVTAFGIFAELENTCEGLIPMEELGFTAQYDEDARQIKAGDTLYRIGDMITVRVEGADIPAAKVKFSLTEGA